jgi:PLP dependent protein
LPSSRSSEIASRLAEVRARIGEAAARAGRATADVRLIAVSKTFPVEDIRSAYDVGQLDFGENRVQDAVQKVHSTTDTTIRWHLIGHLQSNKARKAVEACPVIHSIDSVDLLRRVDRAAGEAGRSPDLLIQVDLALEPTKHGAPIDGLAGILEEAQSCTAVRVVGLMLLPPLTENPEDTRVWFRRLREERDRLAARESFPLPELSMGMSHDFEVAVEEGATMVRVGSAIFGSR